MGVRLLLLSFLVSSSASAFTDPTREPPPPRHRLFYTSTTGGQFNPLGVETMLQTGYRYRLVDSPRMVLRDTFVGLSLLNAVNPAYTRVGVAAELQPLTALTIRASYQHRGYFGVANMLLAFHDPGQSHDDDTLRERSRAGEARTGNLHQLSLQLVLRAKLGPVALFNELNLHHFRGHLHDGGRLFYDAFLDTLVPVNSGLELANHAHLVYLTHFGLVAGVRYTVVHVRYPEAWLAGGSNPNTPTQRIGPVAAYTFHTRSPQFKNPLVVLSLNWWLCSRYRTGEQTAQAVPYLLLGLIFNGDIWTR